MQVQELPRELASMRTLGKATAGVRTDEKSFDMVDLLKFTIFIAKLIINFGVMILHSFRV
jgi:hypothetical protein